MPSGFRAEDYLPDDAGYLPVHEAAEAMGLSEDELVEWASRGWLESSGARVRPAIVTLAGVRDAR